ncbi:MULTISPECIES: hypothetical protein [unclassified Janthinobacterium]|uniref:hypothetical protein n=1 Tax=unclassified Janthinobacterium TaxID=2610881 RepID=UPI00034D09D8|nr:MULTISPECIES: hypothetical protein [unclassified Janthinobacterium]MEC5164090.1 hypothetical protein [Janthinobacterium sp. CG_S6]
MRPWLSRTLLVAGGVVLCWIGVAWYWRAGNRMPGGAELAGGLVMLPLVLLLAVWGGGKAAALMAAAPAPAGAAPDAPAAPAPVAATAVMLAGALRMPHGASAEELAQAILTKQARLALDPELLDDNGFPLLSGRVADIDELAQEELMADWLRQQAGQPRLEAEQWRALALAGDVAAELARAATLHPLLAAYLQAAPSARAALAPPVLQLLPLLPDEWDQEQRTLAGHWLLHIVAAQGWPAERLALSGPAEREGASAFQSMAELADLHVQTGQPYLSIVLACASHVGERSVAAWSARGRLLTAANAGGEVPGEGAAGLLLADAGQALLVDADAAVVLHRAAHGLRATSADAKGRADIELLAALSAQALLCAAPGASVGLLAADTDQRSSRVGELMGMANAALPELDLASQVISVAASCGSAGAVPALAALVLARQACAEQPGLYALCVSNQHSHQRGAVLVGPRTPATV